MGPRLIIVGNIGAYDPAQVRFPEHDDVVQALPADRANEPLNAESNFRYTQPAFRIVEALDVVEYISSRFVSSANFFTQSRNCDTCTPQSCEVRT